jgi:hypothetical protein
MLKQLPSVASVHAQPPVQLRAGAVVGSNKLGLEALWGGERERGECQHGKERERVYDCDIYGTWGGLVSGILFGRLCPDLCFSLITGGELAR